MSHTQLIAIIINSMIEAHRNGMPDTEVFSAAVTAIVSAARMSNNLEIMPKLLEQAMASQDIKSAIVIH